MTVYKHATISEPPALANYYFDEKTNKNFNYFWIGFIVYAAGFTFATTTKIHYVIAEPFQAIGLFLIVFSAVKLIKFSIQNKYLRFVYIVYCVWILTIISRGFLLEFQFIKEISVNAEHGLFLFFVPLILLFPQNIFFYKKMFTVIIILAVIFIFYTLLFLHQILNVKDYTLDSADKYIYEFFTKSLSVPVGFLIISYVYHSSKIKWFSLLVVFVTVLFAIIRARRGLIFLSISPVIIASIIYAYSAGKKFLVLLVYLFIASLFLGYQIKKHSENSNGVSNLLVKRIDEDSRTGVEVCLYNDMTTKDWIIGKGINGEYYCPDIDINDKTGYRKVIETDYLNIILKGGLISVVLLLLITIPAIIKGLFYSKNLFSKTAALWILLWLISLYPATVHAFTLNYLLVWISIGICYNKGIRNIPEKLMTIYLHGVNHIAKEY